MQVNGASTFLRITETQKGQMLTAIIQQELVLLIHFICIRVDSKENVRRIRKIFSARLR